eukprot:TRINITY_DN94464_c0_g1_i1.p1 TRINITY_DN94464_c0_g1~~TRINITY_DN94464_c0_g1_i1.p1  ORF type:complete len:782 (-),score=134.28 TRINITY_DN94464_c0_g1_i1:175-2520(-)
MPRPGEVSVKGKALLLLALICSAEAVRVDNNIQEALRLQTNSSIAPVVDIGMKAVSVYANGNCQFKPLFDVAHFMMETSAAPALEAGAGLLVKPAITSAATAAATTAGTAVATEAVKVGSKRVLIGRLMGSAAGMATPLGIALNVVQIGMTVHQLYTVHQMLMEAKKPPPVPEVTTLDPAIVLAAGAVLVVAGGTLYVWHRKMHSVAYDKAICPKDRWIESPSLDFQYGNSTDDSSVDEDGEDMGEVEDRVAAALEEKSAPEYSSMPRCNGLHLVNVPVACGDDVGCGHETCQQACCDSKDCSMYQFQVPSGRKMQCFLGNSSKIFNTDHCGSWYGEKKVESNSFTRDFRLNDQIQGLKNPDRREFTNTAKKTCPSDQDLDNAECVKSTCREVCKVNSDCTFFQLYKRETKSSSADCWLGETSLAEVQPWYGGIAKVNSNIQGCKEDEYFCPSSQVCTSSCSSCNGFSIEGSDRRCKRTAEEGICDPRQWQDSHNGVNLTQVQCQGLKLVTAVVDEESELDGHSVCREVCCGDPSCVLYQLRQSKAGLLKPGDKVYCWLGKVDSANNPSFTCSASHTKFFFDRRQWTGGSLAQRGCSSGKFSCLLANECVDSCQTDCPGAPETDEAGRTCMAPTLPESPGSSFIQFPDSDAKPILETASEESYFLGAGKSSADILLMVTQNKHRLISSTAGTTICSTLATGNAISCEADSEGCVCKYQKEQSCETWFSKPKQVRDVISDQGMLLVPGDQCKCSANSCSFGVLKSIPALKLSEGDQLALNIL